MDEPFISIITPVFNGEDFIEECIKSVLCQNYDNWEYIIVNNCSTDRTLEIAQKYADADDRITIFDNSVHLGHLENGNHAFKKISPKSKYCKMLHADDWLFEECISKMVEIAEEYPSVGIVSSYRLDNDKVNLDGLPYQSNFFPGKEIGRRFLLDREYYFGSPTSLLIRSALIRKRNKIYEPSNIHSDVTACLDMLRESDFGFVHQVLTFTRRHQTSITSTKIENQSTDMISRFIELLDYGPYFLDEDELKRRLKETENLFYIRLARMICLSDKKNILKKYSSDLSALNMHLRYEKLIKSLFLELLKIPIKYLMGQKITY